jgi:uncharacterized protein
MAINPVVIEVAEPLAEARKWLDSHAREHASKGLRRLQFEGEVRAQYGDGPPKITGYAAVFNQITELWPGFKEQVAPGAFNKTLTNGDDVRALFNHDPNFILGRTGAKTLTLSEDAKGLSYSIVPPDTQAARDLMVSIKRGDINQSSFGFEIVNKSTAVDREKNEMTRTLLEVRLYDVSPVTFPAYPQTEVKVRMFRNDKECVFCLEDDIEPITVPVDKPAAEVSDKELFQRLDELKKRIRPR